MRKSRFTEEQIIQIIKGVEAGGRVADACRSYGISEQTYHRWKAKYGGLDVSEARRLKHLEEENRRLKHLVADLTLDNRMLKDVVAKSGEGLRTQGSSSLLAADLRCLTAQSRASVVARQLQLTVQITPPS